MNDAILPPSSSAPATVRAARLRPWSGTGRVFELSLGQMLWSRRTVFMLLVMGAPVVLAFALRALVELGLPVARVRGATLDGGTLFGLMFWAMYVRLAVPVLAVFYGTALIADEVEDRTLTYLFTRPVRREAVFLGKYLAYLLCTVAVVLPSLVCVWAATSGIGGRFGDGVLDLGRDLVILVAGLAAYGALFGWVGARMRRPLVIGLVFVFGWEVFLLALPGYLKALTVGYYLQALVPHAMPADSSLLIMQAVFRDSPGGMASIIGLAVITGLSLVAGARAAARREYILAQ